MTYDWLRGKRIFAGGTVASNWARHLARGSLGGTDFPLPVGTNVYAHFDGTVKLIPNNGTAGHTITLRRSDGWEMQYMHLNRFTVKNGAQVKLGQHIAETGNTGNSSGPHLHIHARRLGVRFPYTRALVNRESVSAPSGIPWLKLGSRGQRVKQLQRALNSALKPKPALKVDGVYGRLTRTEVFRLQQIGKIRRDGIYGPSSAKVLKKIL